MITFGTRPRRMTLGNMRERGVLTVITTSVGAAAVVLTAALVRATHRGHRAERAITQEGSRIRPIEGA